MATEPPSLHLVVMDGQRVKGTTKPAKPLTQAEGEASLVDFLRGLEDRLADRNEFWEQIAIMRVKAERQARERGG